MVEKTKTLELKKHVATIHSANKLSLLQRKIANALLFNAYDELLEKDEHEIHIAALTKLIGYDSNDSKTIKKSLVNLLATVIEWNLVDGERINGEGGVWNASSIIADASIDGPVCTYSYSNKMKKLLHHPELYGRLNMAVQAKFQSSYGLALYENCIRFQNIEHTPWFDMAKFRKLMGVEDGKYKIFRDFKNRVLDKALEEVNKYSPIKISVQYQKIKRQVVAIQFLIKQTKPHNLAFEFSENNSLQDVLKLKFGLSKRQIEETITTYDKNYIFEKTAMIEASASYKSGKINNLGKYLISALKDDYQATKSSKNVSKMTMVENKIETPKQFRMEQRRVEEYHRYQNKEIIRLFNQQTKTEKKTILNAFEKQLGKGIYFDIYKRDGLTNVLIQDQLSLFIRQRRHALLDEIQSLEDFCEAVV